MDLLTPVCEGASSLEHCAQYGTMVPYVVDSCRHRLLCVSGSIAMNSLTPVREGALASTHSNEALSDKRKEESQIVVPASQGVTHPLRCMENDLALQRITLKRRKPN